MTKVSIITPVYKSTDEQFNKTYASLKAQSNLDFEWIIVLDGLTADNGVYRIDKTFPIKRIVLSENYGPSVARNVGFQVADGDIITYVDAGDELSSGRVEHIVQILNNTYPNIELLFDSHTIVQPDATFFYNSWRNHVVMEELYSIDVHKALSKGNIAIPMDVSHTRRPFVRAGGFQRGIVCGEDGILWRRMLNFVIRDNIMFSDFDAGRYYVLPDSQARTQRRFDMGGFAFDAGNEEGSHGQYLDKDWFLEYNSRDLFDKEN